MDRQSIDDMLAGACADHLGRVRPWQHHFDGASPKLRKLRGAIARIRADATFDIRGERMVVTIAATIDRAVLGQDAALFEKMADAAGVQYDGVGIMLEPVADIPPIAPFERHFRQGDILSFGIDDARHGHAIFIAGSRKDGWLFDISALVTAKPARGDAVLAAPRFYRQPIMAIIDPTRVVPVAGPQGAPVAIPQRVDFRLATGFPAPDDISAIAASVGISPFDETCWPDLLARLDAAGRRLRDAESICYSALIGRGGRIGWREGAVIPEADIVGGVAPMPFGVRVDLDMIVEALRGGPDRLGLHDRVL